MVPEAAIHRWGDDIASPKAAVHILHGMAEHAGRYARAAAALNAEGFIVWAHDHRGHGLNPTPPVGLGHFADKDGWRLLIEDALDVTHALKKAHPGVPVVLMGHSMGSFAAETLLAEHGSEYKAGVLSGTNGPPDFQESVLLRIARTERFFKGGTACAEWVNGLTFSQFNKPFAPNRTPFDWLSRDEAEVDLYVHSDLCGFVLTTQSWVDFLEGRQRLGDDRLLQGIPKGLPIRVFSGTEDPVGGMGKGVQRLLDRFAALGLTRVSHKFYECDRHETLNELDREKVTKDLIEWLKSVA